MSIETRVPALPNIIQLLNKKQNFNGASSILEIQETFPEMRRAENG